MNRLFLKVTSLAICAALGTGCTTMSHALNPFYEPPSPVAYKGDRNDHALNETSNKSDTARQALEQMGSYQATHLPQPNNPVMQPAVVRMMWVPDHLNKNGDLVPGHYYYLKVLSERWAVKDAFELEGQLGQGSGGATSAVPFVFSDQRVR